ncbi:hypothetical protein CEXT_438421, partial [Caerostris extrusa]
MASGASQFQECNRGFAPVY